jgi:putative transposase
MLKKFEELTDSQWEYLMIFLPVQRKRKINLRSVANAILKVLTTGMQWRNLDDKYPNWNAVYYYFYRWGKDGTLDDLLVGFNEMERACWGKEASPSLVCVDSQSVKSVPFVDKDKGVDGNKGVKGRKRQVLVDTLGLVWAVFVHAANGSDTIAGQELLKGLNERLNRVKKILVDGGYKGSFVEAGKNLGIEVEISSRPETSKGFVPLKWRWVSERTFGWLNFNRRLDKEREKTTQSSENWIKWANIKLIINRFEYWQD